MHTVNGWLFYCTQTAPVPTRLFDANGDRGDNGNRSWEAIMNRIVWAVLFLLMAVPVFAQQPSPSAPPKPAPCRCGTYPFNPYGCPDSKRDNYTKCCDHSDIDRFNHSLDSCNKDKAKDPVQLDLNFQNLKIVEDTKEIATLQKSGGNESQIQQLQNDIQKAQAKISQDLESLKHWNCSDMQKEMDNAEQEFEKCMHPVSTPPPTPTPADPVPTQPPPTPAPAMPSATPAPSPPAAPASPAASNHWYCTSWTSWLYGCK